jgi:ribulose-5-phosphate 4-epimerase/fuculose-1-phosphate aldolase
MVIAEPASGCDSAIWEGVVMIIGATQVERHGSALYSAEEWATRVALAASYRIAALEGLDDGIFNHFSCAVPGEPGHFLLKPFGPLFSEITASGLIKVDLDGRIVAGTGRWEPTAFHIHSRIHAAIPRAACVLHTHMPYATALTNLADMRIQPINQSTIRFVRGAAYLDTYGGLVLDAEEGDRIVAALAEHDVLLMANHGVMVIGPTVSRCVYDLHYLEVAARDQWYALATGRELRLVPDDIVDRTARQMVDERDMANEPHFAAMLRRLDRENPGYDC